MKPVDLLIIALIATVVILALRSMRRKNSVGSCQCCDKQDCPYRHQG